MKWDSDTILRDAWIAFALIWLAAAFTNKRTVRRQAGAEFWIHIALLGVAFNLLLSDIFRRGFLLDRFVPRSPAIEWTGVAVTLAGILFAIWARVHIGTNWSGTITLKEGHTLVRTGPYTLVRHPIYTGILLAVLGTAVSVGQVRCLLGFALLVIELKRKSLIEERLMIEQFGTQYVQFRRQVKGLVPFVW